MLARAPQSKARGSPEDEPVQKKKQKVTTEVQDAAEKGAEVKNELVHKHQQHSQVAPSTVSPAPKGTYVFSSFRGFLNLDRTSWLSISR